MSDTLNNVQFEADLNKFFTALNVDYKLGIRKVALDIFEGVIARSPVDTGRSRGSWTVNTYFPDPVVLPPRDEKLNPYPPPSFDLPTTSLNGLPDVYISNNLDYITYLEDGSSKQAKEGMLEVTVKEVHDEILNILGVI